MYQTGVTGPGGDSFSFSAVFSGSLAVNAARSGPPSEKSFDCSPPRSRSSAAPKASARSSTMTPEARPMGPTLAAAGLVSAETTLVGYAPDVDEGGPQREGVSFGLREAAGLAHQREELLARRKCGRGAR